MSDEEVIERKLLLDDGNGDTRLNMLLKLINKFKEEFDNQLYNDTLNTLRLCELSFSKSVMIRNRIQEDIVIYKKYQEKEDNNIENIRATIKLVKEMLKKSNDDKEYKIQYDLIENEILKYPARADIRGKIDEIKIENEQLKKVRDLYDYKLAMLRIYFAQFPTNILDIINMTDES